MLNYDGTIAYKYISIRKLLGVFVLNSGNKVNNRS